MNQKCIEQVIRFSEYEIWKNKKIAFQLFGIGLLLVWLKWLWLIFIHIHIYRIIVYWFKCILFFIQTELPETKPHLWADRERYEPGDVLIANCSSPPSRPRVELKLSINNLVVSNYELRFRTTSLIFLHCSDLLAKQFARMKVGKFIGTQWQTIVVEKQIRLYFDSNKSWLTIIFRLRNCFIQFSAKNTWIYQEL